MTNYHLLQPVKIIDPHLVSSFFDNYKRVYLHATTELENRSNLVAECSLNIQVTTELEGNICLVEHLQTQHLSIPAGSRVQYTFPEVCDFYYLDRTQYFVEARSIPLISYLLQLLLLASILVFSAKEYNLAALLLQAQFMVAKWYGKAILVQCCYYC